MGSKVQAPPDPSLHPWKRWYVADDPLGPDNGQGGQVPAPPNPIGSVCTLIRTGEGELVITGDESLLQEVFETKPGQWLRNLALTKDEPQT